MVITKGSATILLLSLVGFVILGATSSYGLQRHSSVPNYNYNDGHMDSIKSTGRHDQKAGPSIEDDHVAVSAENGNHLNLGELLPLWSCVPFAGMLLSIAFLPLIAPEIWHHHFGKISALWAAAMAVPFFVIYRNAALYEIIHIILADYIPFIILLGALYTVSGGILLRGTLRGTPVVNTTMLIIGTVLASWMGTTGAAMLMIRPFLRANSYRKNRTFMVVFFIFLVGNIGGSLTPLGDPPLFLGFLHGVSFFWTLHLLPHMIFVTVLLLLTYFIMDSYTYSKEKDLQALEQRKKEPLSLAGKHNFLFLVGIVGSVLLSGIVDWGEVTFLGVHRGLQDWLRDAFLILMGIASMLTTPLQVREDNDFTWFPIIEVAYLFIGIFITMIPCLLILKAGVHGQLAFIIEAVKKPAHYFWIAGIFSSFLDNAPTYLTFLNTALGSFYANLPESRAVSLLMHENTVYLIAISAGSVFFGACSYIGNAPNFMVRSIAEESGTPMPSFFGYVFKYSLLYLMPAFIAVTVIFF